MNLRTRFALAFAAIAAVVAGLVGLLSYKAAADRITSELDRTLRTATTALENGQDGVVTELRVSGFPINTLTGVAVVPVTKAQWDAEVKARGDLVKALTPQPGGAVPAPGPVDPAVKAGIQAASAGLGQAAAHLG